MQESEVHRVQSSNTPSGFWLLLLYSSPMFDIVRPQISTAADKLTHLRRFL